MSKNIIVLTALFLLAFTAVPATSYAFLYDVQVKDKDAIRQLSDEQLKENYISVLIDLKASEVYSVRGGFNVNDYKMYKELLRYRVYLELEFQRRNLKVPEIEL